MTGNGDAGFRVRASMTFSEQAHPAFVGTLRGLSSRGRSRLIHALVERGLSLTSVAVAAGQGQLDARSGSAVAGAGNAPSPLDALGSAGSLEGSEELGA